LAEDQKTPLVFWHYNGNQGTLTLLEARARAEALIMAAAIAETEAKIAVNLTGIDSAQLRGFGKTAKRTAAEKTFIQLRQIMRDARSPLPKGITPIFGQRTHLPLVEITLYGKPIQPETHVVRDHAFALLACAEASESDRLLHYFFHQTLDVSIGNVSAMLQEFAGFRNRVQLQDLLDKR
jgi:hypothetical protein